MAHARAGINEWKDDCIDSRSPPGAGKLDAQRLCGHIQPQKPHADRDSGLQGIHKYSPGSETMFGGVAGYPSPVNLMAVVNITSRPYARWLLVEITSPVM